MDPFENLIRVSPKLTTVQEFCEFTEDIHDTIKCDQTDCDFEFY